VSRADAVETVRSATETVGADVVIVACSSAQAQEQAMEMAAPRGRVLFFGGLPKGTTHIQFPSNVLHYQEVQVHGSYASRHRDQVHALDMLAAGVGGLRRVISEVVDLDAAADAFARIRAGNVLKIVVRP
jgi:L-iditol 2-dehydrogenase